MKIKIFYILFFIHCNIAFSQVEYYEYINNAEKFLLNKNFKKTDSCYKLAFSLDSLKGFSYDYLIASSNALLNKDTNLFRNYLKQFIKRGGNINIEKYKFERNKLIDSMYLIIDDYILNN